MPSKSVRSEHREALPAPKIVGVQETFHVVIVIISQSLEKLAGENGKNPRERQAPAFYSGVSLALFPVCNLPLALVFPIVAHASFSAPAVSRFPAALF